MTASQTSRLREKLAEIADVTATIALLQWDQEIYMPPKAAPGRGKQLATLSALAHRMSTDPQLGELLHRLRDAIESLEADDAKLVEEALYDYDRAARLPEAVVHTFAEVRSNALQAWVKAREESCFAAFQPHLERLVALLIEKADYLGYEGSPYNALLEDYERGMTAGHLQTLFADLAPKQRALVEKLGCAPQPDAAWLDQTWDEKAQWDFSLCVLRDMGYDLEAGRQDKSAHPFTTNFDFTDVRITTRINPADLFSGLMASIHEGGHALYEQGFQEKDRRSTLAQAPSLGAHESQSRMWENLVGRSLPFWKHYMSALRGHFPDQLDRVEPEQVWRALNRVRPSLIRVEADECTYNLHIVLRFEIEVALIERQVKVADIPDIWNAKMKQYLGLDVPDDARGCLQDVHWSHGAMGYFPTYALGNLYAAQLFEQILRDIPHLWDSVASGDFAPLLAWLREHVHQHGRRKTAARIVQDATGSPPSSTPFLRYLETKYTALYDLTY